MWGTPDAEYNGPYSSNLSWNEHRVEDLEYVNKILHEIAPWLVPYLQTISDKIIFRKNVFMIV